MWCPCPNTDHELLSTVHCWCVLCPYHTHDEPENQGLPEPPIIPFSGMVTEASPNRTRKYTFREPLSWFDQKIYQINHVPTNNYKMGGFQPELGKVSILEGISHFLRVSPIFCVKSLVLQAWNEISFGLNRGINLNPISPSLTSFDPHFFFKF